MMHYKIYSHADADGAIAALIFREHLRRVFGNRISVVIEPVDYSLEDQNKLSWFDKPLSLPCAVLDFALHPSLLLPRTFAAMNASADESNLGCYWLDHHISGGQIPFLTPENFAQHCPAGLKAIWDPTALSTPGLLRTHRKSLNLRLDVLEEFEVLIDYSEIIDGALYPSAAQAHEFSSVAVQLAALFSCRHPALDGAKFYNKLIDDLEAHSTRDVRLAFDADPIYAAMLDYEQRQLHARRVSYAQVARSAGHERISIFDFRDFQNIWHGIARFVPYVLMPQCHYAIHIAPPDERGFCSVTCGQNPWNRPAQPAELGNFFWKQFNGGGHQHVAGGRFKHDDTTAIPRMVSFLSAQLTQNI